MPLMKFSILQKPMNMQSRLLMIGPEGKWFTEKSKLPEQIKLTVYKVPGEINTDDLSPATDAWSRPDIPLTCFSDV
jgi:aconitate hydratase 2/2-methylisocitrate dehydratase